MGKIKKCTECKYYTMEESCSKCSEKTERPKPPKYSPSDRYGDYRRKTKRQED